MDELLREGFSEPMNDIFPRVYKLIKQRSENPIFPMALKSLNKITHGFPIGPSIVSARTGQGKTAFMLQNAIFQAMKKINVIFLSLEDTKESLVEKAICQRMKIDNQKLKRGFADLIDLEKTTNFSEEVNIYFDDGYGFNFAEIKNVYDEVRFEDGKKANIIYWDYLQMIDETDFKSYNNILRAIRRFSISNKIGFVIGCQQNRQSAMLGAPSNATAKGSGTIEEIAEMIILLNYPYQVGCTNGKYQEGDNEQGFNSLSNEDKRLVWQTYIEISISKNKTGPTFPRLPVEYWGKHYFFQEWSNPVRIAENHRLGFKEPEFSEEEIIF